MRYLFVKTFVAAFLLSSCTIPPSSSEIERLHESTKMRIYKAVQSFPPEQQKYFTQSDVSRLSIKVTEKLTMGFTFTSVGVVEDAGLYKQRNPLIILVNQPTGVMALVQKGSLIETVRP